MLSSSLLDEALELCYRLFVCRWRPMGVRCLAFAAMAFTFGRYVAVPSFSFSLCMNSNQAAFITPRSSRRDSFDIFLVDLDRVRNDKYAGIEEGVSKFK
jgi:hypothetical protein